MATTSEGACLVVFLSVCVISPSGPLSTGPVVSLVSFSFSPILSLLIDRESVSSVFPTFPSRLVFLRHIFSSGLVVSTVKPYTPFTIFYLVYDLA